MKKQKVGTFTIILEIDHKKTDMVIFSSFSRNEDQRRIFHEMLNCSSHLSISLWLKGFFVNISRSNNLLKGSWSVLGKVKWEALYLATNFVIVSAFSSYQWFNFLTIKLTAAFDTNYVSSSVERKTRAGLELVHYFSQYDEMLMGCVFQPGPACQALSQRTVSVQTLQQHQEREREEQLSLTAITFISSSQEALQQQKQVGSPSLTHTLSPCTLSLTWSLPIFISLIHLVSSVSNSLFMLSLCLPLSHSLT